MKSFVQLTKRLLQLLYDILHYEKCQCGITFSYIIRVKVGLQKLKKMFLK